VSQTLNFGLPAPFNIQIAGRNQARNREVAGGLADKIRQVPGAVDVRVQQPADQPKLRFAIDRTKAGKIGLSERDVATSVLLSLSGSGQVQPAYWLNPLFGIQSLINVRVPERDMDSLAALQSIPVSASRPGEGDAQVLANLASVSRGAGPPVVSHYNVMPVIDIFGGVSGRDLGSVLSDLKPLLAQAEKELARARAQLAQTDAALSLAKITARRWADLVKTDSVSEQESAEKQSDLALKAATVEAAQAEVHRLEELQGFAHVTAPFAGTITVRQTDVGQLINATSGRELFRLAQTGTLRVYVRVPQTSARGVTPGQTAEVTVPEIPGRIFPAKVVRTSGAMDAQSRTLLTELELDNARGEILVGSYAQVRFPEAKVEATLTLPSNTLLFRAEGPQVGVVLTDGKVELRTVKLGRDFGAAVEIQDGVQPTDRVILNPADSLVSGTTVRVAEASPPAAAK
jgi:RND family efflux transporter MFP subunit